MFTYLVFMRHTWLTKGKKGDPVGSLCISEMFRDIKRHFFICNINNACNVLHATLHKWNVLLSLTSNIVLFESRAVLRLFNSDLKSKHYLPFSHRYCRDWQVCVYSFVFFKLSLSVYICRKQQRNGRRRWLSSHYTHSFSVFFMKAEHVWLLPAWMQKWREAIFSKVLL